MSSSNPRTDSHVASDAAIAQALANEEQECADAEMAIRMQNETDRGGGAGSGFLSGVLPPPPASRRPVVQGRSVQAERHPSGPASGSRSFPSSSAPHSMMPEAGSFMSRPAPAHMCVVPCVIGEGLCVEMMVDTGAQSSVISLALARELGLQNRIDSREQGIAAGVGQARIVGRIRGVGCEFGHVEFAMDFIVLEVPDKLLLLGLDQMRKYKCLVDLDREVLVFGGADGVEVRLLPPDEQHASFRPPMGCPMM